MRIPLFILCFLLFAISCFSQKTISNIEQPIPYEGDTVWGTLTAPGEMTELIQKNEPLVIFIAGSGPTDRNGNSFVMGGKNDAFLQLADSLAERGITSFRYDKLGIGASKSKISEGEVRFYDNVKVVLKIVEDFKKMGFEKFVIAGHSEGSLVGMLASQKIPEVVGYISIAGPARNAAEVLKTQISASPQLTDELKKESVQNFDSLKAGFEIKKFNPMLMSIFRPSVQPYMISWFEYTATEEIAKLEIPVLVIQGEDDIQIPTAAGEALDHFAQNSTLLLVPNMNHVLKMVEGDEENKASYSEAGFPLSREVVEGFEEFVEGL